MKRYAAKNNHGIGKGTESRRIGLSSGSPLSTWRVIFLGSKKLGPTGELPQRLVFIYIHGKDSKRPPAIFYTI